MVNGTLKLVLSLLILAVGMGCAGHYFLGSARRSIDAGIGAFDGDRPWRRVGAVLCLVIAVMFVVGAYLVDVPARPQARAYAAYWLVLMVLVFWLCGLAIKDVRHTRRLVFRRRELRSPAYDELDARNASTGESP